MEIFKTGFEVTVIGMGVVFLVLIFLSFLLTLFEIVFYKKTDDGLATEPGGNLIAKQNKNQSSPVNNNEEEQIVAVICSSVSTLLNKDEYICNIRQM